MTIRPRHCLLALAALTALALVAGGGWLAAHRDTLAGRFHRQGVRLIDQGKHRLALGEFTYALWLAPGRSELYAARARAYAGAGMPRRALADLHQAIALGPGDAGLHQRLGDLHAGPLADPRAAVRAYDAAIRLAPGDARAYLRRGRAYERLTNPHRALADYTRAIALNPGLVEARLRRAGVRESFRQYDRAAADLSAALRLRPDDAGLRYRRGRLYLRLEAYRKALADFDRVRAAAPGAFHQLDFHRGNANLHLGRYHEAVRDYTRALRRNPYALSAYYNRAQARAQLGRMEQARADWAVVCELEAGGQSDACYRAGQGP